MTNMVNVWLGAENTASVSENFATFAEALAFADRYSEKEYPDAKVRIFADDTRFSSHGDLVVDGELVPEERLGLFGLPTEADEFSITGLRSAWGRALAQNRVAPVEGIPNEHELIDNASPCDVCAECAWRHFPHGLAGDGVCGHPEIWGDYSNGKSLEIHASDTACARSVKD